MKTVGLVVAAGMSTRMGEFKPLMQIGAKTMLEQSVDSLLQAGVDSVVVVVGYRMLEVRALLEASYPRSKIILGYNTQYAFSDMLASIQIGLQVMPTCDAFFLLPGDMPAIALDTFEKLALAYQRTSAKVVFPTLEGYRKHPPLIASQCIQDILAFSGNGGLRALWAQYTQDVIEVAVDDVGCLMDADTKKDLFHIRTYLQNKNYIDIAIEA